MWLVFLLVTVIAVMLIFLCVVVSKNRGLDDLVCDLSDQVDEWKKKASMAGTVAAAAEAERVQTQGRLDAALDEMARNMKAVKDAEALVQYWKQQTEQARQETRKATSKAV